MINILKMKNIVNNIFILSFVLLSIYFISSCNKENPINSEEYCDPDILCTDSSGRTIGGDKTDWCYKGDSNSHFNAVYPNPVKNIFHFNFSLVDIDTISIFFINNIDTLYIIKNEKRDPGHYSIIGYKDSLHYSNIKKRIYIRCNSIQKSDSCSPYGDIQFN
jgi:hypothetical protein